MSTPSEASLIYNWNLKGRRGRLAPSVEFYDETLRDGIQGPSISDPGIEDKIRILELEEELVVRPLGAVLPPVLLLDNIAHNVEPCIILR